MMTAADPNGLYGSATLRAVTGPTLRPGGIALTQRALSLCQLPEKARVVDIGCGSGVTAQYLRSHDRLNAIGLDRSAGMLGEARLRYPGLPIVQADAARLPFGDQRLSAVVCECVLSVVNAADTVLRELCRVLAPGGLLVLADIYLRDPPRGGGRTSFSAASCLQGAKSRGKLVDRLHRSGFSLLLWEDHSDALKRLAAQLVLSGGSFQALWGDADGCAAGTPLPGVAHQTRPGYFIALARKEGPP